MKNFLSIAVVCGACVAHGFMLEVAPGKSANALDDARREIAKLRAEGKIPAGETAEIFFSPGIYPLPETVVFGKDDGNIRVVAKEKGSVRFTGAVQLAVFEQGKDGHWRTKFEGRTPEQLFVNGRRAQRAKSPNEFYFYMKAPHTVGTDPATGKKYADLSYRAFTAYNKDLQGLPESGLSNVVVNVYHSWASSISRLQSVDKETGVVVGTRSSPWKYMNWRPYEQRYVLENYRGALDEPGEWYADPVAKTLEYIPLPGENPSAPLAAVNDKLLRIDGAENISFEGVAFGECAYFLPADGKGDGQAAVGVHGAIEVENSTSVSFKECEIANVSPHAIRFGRNCHDCLVDKCNIHGLGAGGVYIGWNSWTQEQADKGLITSRIAVRNSIIRDGGWIFPAAHGVWIGHAFDCTITHNEISDMKYTGIATGWTWGYRPTVTKNIELSFNHIHHIGGGVLNDMGGIYTLGNQPGSVVTNNHIHDIWSYDYSGRGGWGLYTDEGSRGILFENNLVHGVKTGCIHQHYGRENIFRNNILAFSWFDQIQRSRAEDHTTIIVTNNIVYWDNQSDAVRGQPGDKAKDVVFDSNLYWNSLGDFRSQKAFLGIAWDEWQATGHDRHSAIADPLFADPDNGDFTLATNSPALSLGFKPFNYSKAGIDWQLPPFERKPVVFAPKPSEIAFSGVDTSFEEYSNGAKPGDLSCSGGIAVDSDFARSGGKSLKMTDSDKLPHPWEPHWFISSRELQGTVFNSFSIRAGKGADVFWEYRNYPKAGGYVTLCAFRIRNNELWAQGEKIANIPQDKWTDLAIRYNAKDEGKWEITVNGVPRVFQMKRAPLPVMWVGLGMNGTAPATIWLDDFIYRVDK